MHNLLKKFANSHRGNTEWMWVTIFVLVYEFGICIAKSWQKFSITVFLSDRRNRCNCRQEVSCGLDSRDRRSLPSLTIVDFSRKHLITLGFKGWCGKLEKA